jgi:pimeloyl-ACP methyl ester carboxylesterase
MSQKSYRTPGLVTTEHQLEVPLDHDRPDGEAIALFAREVAAPEGDDKPFLLYLQGGPGHEAPRPTRGSPSWLDRALRDFRVLMLDQRGTGRSSPIGDLAGLTPAEQADRLALFRADAIVRDAELLRAHLGSGPWSALGQSFGGLTLTTYLSHAPEGLREAFFTGGLPAVGRPVDDVYSTTWQIVIERNRRYFERYPEDRDRVHAIRSKLDQDDVRLPTGERLTWRRFRQVGELLGSGDGFERLHYILELDPTSRAFLFDVGDIQNYSRNPLYLLLHEACWADGVATRWSAARTEPPEVDADDLLVAEHMYPEVFDDYAWLAPLREAGHLLAERDWPRLYDADRLRANEVAAAAAVYVDDLYVPRVFSEQTAALIKGLRPWLTNEYEHNGLSANGERVLGRLIDLARGLA